MTILFLSKYICFSWVFFDYTNEQKGIIIKKFFLLNLLFIYTFSCADCYFGCDNIYRDIDTDYSKLMIMLKEDGYQINDLPVGCKINDKKELKVVYIDKDSEKLTLSIVLSKLEPYLNNDEWGKIKVELYDQMKIENTLNYGAYEVLKSSHSADLRCSSFQVGKSNLIYCTYGKDKKLPPRWKEVYKDLGIGEKIIFQKIPNIGTKIAHMCK